MDRLLWYVSRLRNELRVGTRTEQFMWYSLGGAVRNTSVDVKTGNCASRRVILSRPCGEETELLYVAIDDARGQRLGNRQAS